MVFTYYKEVNQNIFILLLHIINKVSRGTSVLSPFAGWTFGFWVVGFLGALGGIIVAFTLKYTDAVMKAFAMSISIILTVFMSWLLLSGPMTLNIVCASVIVIVSTLNYQFP